MFLGLLKSLSHRFCRSVCALCYQTDTRFQLHWIPFCDMRFLMEFLFFLFLSKGIQILNFRMIGIDAALGLVVATFVISFFDSFFIDTIDLMEMIDLNFEFMNVGWYDMHSQFASIWYLLSVVNIEYVIFGWHSIDFIVCALCLFIAIYWWILFPSISISHILSLHMILWYIFEPAVRYSV